MSYPAEFSSEALAGKTVHYKANIKSVGRSETPELNDEWAKSLDEGYESLDDLRQKLRADLEKYADADADARVRNNAISKVLEQNPLEIPNTLIENQTRRLLNDFARDLQQRGVDLNKVETDFIQMAYHNMRQQAERDVRGAMLLDKIGGIENVEITDAELDEEIARLAEYYHASPEEVRESMEKQGGGLEDIRGNLKTRKTIEAVVSHATVTDGPWQEEKPEEPAAAASEKPKKTRKKKAAESE